MTYTIYSDSIDCTVNDKVLVYKKNILNESGLINEDMVGIIEKVEQKECEDFFGSVYLSYKVQIRMKSGQKIVIKDTGQAPFFRKYEFITLRDLEKLQRSNVASEQTVR